ncbi:sensor domain-containing diguanylate cyclase [Catenovulum sp. SM1970]|uniref:diguanylate cyclase domain-containing protein n=1 Tax=Marinifaba aquimaris TaxID=2741323 RepID=UPI001573034A|nr:sensor domain-containing diguanylate cyclase [Marinifaba aquimaris]
MISPTSANPSDIVLEPPPITTQPDKLIVVNSKAWKPYSYLTADGEPAGILVDFWREYGRLHNVDIEFYLTDWHESLQAVKVGKADVHAGLVYSEPRDQFLDFGSAIMALETEIYLSKHAVTVNVSQALLGENKAEVGVVRDSFEAYKMNKIYPNAKIKSFDNNELMFQAVTQKQIELFVADSLVANFYLSLTENRDYYFPVQHLYDQDIRIAVSDNSHHSIELISERFDQISDAERERIHYRWSQVETVYPKFFIPLSILLFLVAVFYHVRSLKRTVILKTQQLKLANEQLKELSLTDPLTQVHNRRFFMEQLAKNDYCQYSLTVMILDLDDFKSINDHYGHCFGDHVLRSVAQTLKSVLPEQATLARIGGEEFAVIISHLNENTSRQLAEKVCRTVNQVHIKQQEIELVVSCSLGCVFYSSLNCSAEINDADQLMYRAKSQGKNQVCFSHAMATKELQQGIPERAL